MNINDNAPDFTLSDGDGNDWTLSDHRGEVVVLLFYPGDDTPVCTKQLCSVRDNWQDYRDAGATVVGISTDSVESHKRFAEKYGLPFTLLADPGGEVVNMYGAGSWLPGRSARAVVVVGKDGTVKSHNVQPLSIFRPKDEDILEAVADAAAA